MARAFRLDSAGEGGKVNPNDVFYLLQESGCSANKEKHTVRQWLTNFGIPIEDQYHADWTNLISELSVKCKKLQSSLTEAEMKTVYNIITIGVYLNYHTDQEFEPQFMIADRTDLLLIADSGPGITTEKGLITPKFGSKPENHVAVSLSMDAFGELLLATQAHYQAWLTAWYMGGCKMVQSKTYTTKEQTSDTKHQNNQTAAPAPAQAPYVPDAYLGIGSSMNDDDDLPF